MAHSTNVPKFYLYLRYFYYLPSLVIPLYRLVLYRRPIPRPAFSRRAKYSHRDPFHHARRLEVNTEYHFIITAGDISWEKVNLLPRPMRMTTTWISYRSAFLYNHLSNRSSHAEFILATYNFELRAFVPLWVHMSDGNGMYIRFWNMKSNLNFSNRKRSRCWMLKSCKFVQYGKFPRIVSKDTYIVNFS